MTIESTIEPLESRIAPALITSPAGEPAPDPATLPEDEGGASPTVTPPDASLTGPDFNDLTNLQDLTTVTDLTDVSRAVANLGLAPASAAGAPLTDATSPILRSDPTASISPDSLIAVLGLDRVDTTAFPGPVQLLGASGVLPLFDSSGLMAGGLTPVPAR